jgi:hypothetical protein
LTRPSRLALESLALSPHAAFLAGLRLDGRVKPGHDERAANSSTRAH